MTPSAAVARTARALAVDLVSAEVVGAFAEAGVPSILLKGPSHAAWLYDDGAVRAYGDTALRVPPALLDRAGEVLGALGFVLDWDGRHGVESCAYAQTWLRGDGAFVDLHWRLPGFGAADVRQWEVLATRSVAARVGGATVHV